MLGGVLSLGAIGWLSLATMACGDGSGSGPGAAEAAPVAAVAQSKAEPVGDLADAPGLGPGRIVWESNRSGAWRLWAREFDAREVRQISRDEPSRQHCCSHLSPAGDRLVYLALEAGDERYPADGARGELRLLGVTADGSAGAERVLASVARTYFEHRAAIWRDAQRLLFIDGDGRTIELELADEGAELGRRVLVEEGPPGRGWLLDPGLRWAVEGTPRFSPYDAARRAIRAEPSRGGCQPYFSHDGRFGFWIAGAGGPIRVLDLERRTFTDVVRKGDPRLPHTWRYLYFPMLSAEGTFLAWGASDGSHDHHGADYEIFLAETDPQTLELLAPPRRVSHHPGTDRFPTLWAAPLSPDRRAARSPLAADRASVDPAPAGTGFWPARRDGLVFLWHSGDRRNLVADPLAGGESATLLEPQGLAWLDRDFAMVIRGGAFVADEGTMTRLFHGLRETNEMTFEARIEAAEAVERLAAVLAFGNARWRNLLLAQEDGRWTLRLRTPSTPRSADPPAVDLGPARPGQSQHLLVTYRAGELRSWLDGEPAGGSDILLEGFFPWKQAPLLFGSEWTGRNPWHGRVEGVAVWNRILGETELTEQYRHALAEHAERPEIPRWRLRGRLVTRSPIPTLAEISPYREALATFEFEVEEVLSGTWDQPRARVVFRVLLDGERMPITHLAPGSELVLDVEPFLDQPQLESLYLSDDLPPAPGTELLYSDRIEG